MRDNNVALNFITPYSPFFIGRHRSPCKELQIIWLRTAFDDSEEVFGLVAVVLFGEETPILLPFELDGSFSSSCENDMLGGISKISSQSQSWFNPSKNAFWLKTPRPNNIVRFFYIRVGSPKPEMGVICSNVLDGHIADFLVAHQVVVLAGSVATCLVLHIGNISEDGFEFLWLSWLCHFKILSVCDAPSIPETADKREHKQFMDWERCEWD